MIEKVITGITQALDAEFGYPVHIDDVEQELNPPCFLVDRVQGGLQKKLGNRYKTGNCFDIKYFTDTEKPTLEYLSLEERLYTCLEYIDVQGSPTRGTDMKGCVIDDIFHFFVNYKFEVIKRTIPAEKMGDMTIRTTLGGEKNE